MTIKDAMSFKSKKLLFDELLNLAIWAITFGAVYWLGTNNLWLCFFITLALIASFSNNKSKDVLNILHPIHKDIDRYISELKEKCDQLEVEVDELRSEIRKLNIKVNDLDT